MQQRRLVLASGSPRRRELLSRMGHTFETCSPDVDENVSGLAREIVCVLAKRKASAVAEGYRDAVIIASDTLVSLDGVPLGKPADAKDAIRMLHSLSGRVHEVYTGVCILDTLNNHIETRCACTSVSFRKLSDAEILAYVETGEPMDKAGAYGIQGGAGAFVDHLDGSFENVMGFPTDVVRDMLLNFGL